MPQEIETYYLLPAIRREFVLCMLKEGLAQRQIAEKLGITEAAVSQYMKGRRAGKIKFEDKIEAEIKNSVSRILGSKTTVLEEMRLICGICKKEMVLCRIHMAECAVPDNCRICLEG